MDGTAALEKRCERLVAGRDTGTVTEGTGKVCSPEDFMIDRFGEFLSEREENHQPCISDSKLEQTTYLERHASCQA